jgi:glycosyltransferase involved in cell wall biosynthesis
VSSTAWHPEGVSATYIAYPTLPVVGRPLNGFTMAARFLPYIRRYQPDILLNYVVYPDGLAAVRIARALNVPVVLTAIGSDLNRIPDPLCAALTRYTLRHATRVTTVSRDLAKTAIALGADPARTIPILNGCDTAVFHPQARNPAREALGIPLAADVIVYIGRLDLRKGLLELIDAVAQLRTQRPDLHCYVVGEGPDRPKLLEAIGRHQAEASITLVPSCPTDKVALWMAATDLVTLPSYREGCPNVIVEALAAGRPVVASNVGGIPELMDESCGRLIPSHNVPELARALDEVLSQTWDSIAISSRHNRSWSDVAADLHQVLLEACSCR